MMHWRRLILAGPPMQLVINTCGASLRKHLDRFLIIAGGRRAEFSAHKVQSILITTAVQLSTDALELAVRHNIEAGIGALEKLGCKTVELDMPHTEYAIAVYYILMTAEASSNLARFDGVRYGPRDLGDGTLMGMYRATRGHKFGDEVKRRIVLGTYVLSAGYYDAYYRKAQQVRALITRDFEDAFKKVDLIVTPTSPAPPAPA